VTRVAVLVAGAIAMIAGACTFSWWRLTATESFGLRELHVCAFDACKPFDYASIVGSDGQTFATLGTVACYGAFAVGALALITAYACWQKTIVAVSAARLTGIAALALIAVAIAFVLERPEIFDVSTSRFERASYIVRSASIGWSAVAYLAGAAAVVIASALLSRRRAA
jgi:hypothetical protein